MSSSSILITNLSLHLQHRKLSDQHFYFIWTFNSLILTKLFLQIYEENLLTAHIQFIWLFKPPLSMHSFPHLTYKKRPIVHIHSIYDNSNHPLSMHRFPHLKHGNHPIAYVQSPYDYSIHSLLEVCSTSATTKFYTDINDDLQWRLLSDHDLDWLSLQIKARAILTHCQ